MTRTRLSVEAAGPLTTIQDAGRFGHLRHGVTWSGPVEALGFAAANAALGNPPGSPAIELSHGGIVLRCLEGRVRFALAGGDFAATLDGQRIGAWTTGVLGAGARLVIRDGAEGNWATLAFAGQIEVSRWLGSAATLALAGLGAGRVEAGAVLTIEAAPVTDSGYNPIAPPPMEIGPIRIVPGPQSDYFAAETRALLTDAAFAAAPAFDRMGMVLDGPPLPPLDLTLLSTPVIRGGIQVNGAGSATILLADHQTTAGYPRIATVISADLARAAQLRPGTPLRFATVCAAEAVAIARQTDTERRAWLARVVDTRSLHDRLLSTNLVDGVFNAVDA
jgi:allophanate hydrolase